MALVGEMLDDNLGQSERPHVTRLTSGSTDAVAAFGALADALESNAEDQRLLAHRIRVISQARREGRSWTEVLGDEDEPGTVQLVSRVLGRISLASGTLRKALVLELRAEGASIPAIARLFGVTHQRVSNLLRSTNTDN